MYPTTIHQRINFLSCSTFNSPKNKYMALYGYKYRGVWANDLQSMVKPAKVKEGKQHSLYPMKYYSHFEFSNLK